MHTITWPVIHGKALWRTIWFPTANVAYEGTPELDGVYRMTVILPKNFAPQKSSAIYSAVGTYRHEHNLLEAYILDFEGDLYDQEITVYLTEKIRENKEFSNINELVHQLNSDKASVSKRPRIVMTFGTFDHTHDGHLAYLTQARMHGDHLVTIVARNENIKKIKWKEPLLNETQRMKAVQNFQIPNHSVQFGDSDNVYQCLDDREPQVVYLWYDQHSFDEGIIAYCTHNNITTPEIIRWTAHQPEKYKSSIIKKKLYT